MRANLKRLDLKLSNFIVFFVFHEDTPRLFCFFNFRVKNEIEEAKCSGGLIKLQIKNPRVSYYPSSVLIQKQSIVVRYIKKSTRADHNLDMYDARLIVARSYTTLSTIKQAAYYAWSEYNVKLAQAEYACDYHR